jgi:hypothetical protein
MREHQPSRRNSYSVGVQHVIEKNRPVFRIKLSGRLLFLIEEII